VHGFSAGEIDSHLLDGCDGEAAADFGDEEGDGKEGTEEGGKSSVGGAFVV